jgi:hypothetical protein
LDVAAAALPILTLGDAPPDMALVRPSDRALEGGLVRARSAADLGRQLVRLLASPAERASRGESLCAASRARHSDEWTMYLEEVVRAACERRGLAVPPQAPPPARPAAWECVLRLLYDVDGLSTTIAVMNNAAALPADVRPRDDVAGDALARAIVAAAATGRRVLAKPAVELDALIEVVERMRVLWAAGDVDRCIVALPPGGFRDGVTLLQRALDLGGDFEIDVVPAASLDEIAGPGDIVLE